MRMISTLCLFAILSACVTTYQPVGFTGGFSETQLGENVWRVTFHGNGYTREERAEDLALLRSADLTLEKGYTHFALASSRSNTKTETYTTPSTSYTTGSVYSSGNYATGNATTYTTGGDTDSVSKPSSSNIVVMFKGKPDVQGMVYDAKFICQSIGQKYQATCGEHK